MEVGPNGGSDRPEADIRAEAVLFAVEGSATLKIGSATHSLGPGGYAYLPPGAEWTLRNHEASPLRFHWIRESYERVEGLQLPEAFVTNEKDIDPISMPGTEGKWSTTRFVDPTDLRHDMHVNIVNLEPDAAIPFAEPCHGARALCAGRQDGLLVEPRLGRS